MKKTLLERIVILKEIAISLTKTYYKLHIKVYGEHSSNLETATKNINRLAKKLDEFELLEIIKYQTQCCADLESHLKAKRKRE